MRLSRNSLLCISLILAIKYAHTGEVVSAENNSATDGQDLFQEYGCSQCHGADGATPGAKYVPVIRGQASEEIFKAAREILLGNKTSEFSGLMHNLYCDPTLRETDCTPAPTDTQLWAIANWLAQPVELPKKKRTPQNLYLTSRETHALIEKNRARLLFVDIRTRAEAAFVGQPGLIDAHVTFLESDFDVWDDRQQSFKVNVNPGFIDKIRNALKRKALDSDDRIILICRSGKRSAQAARILYVSGFKNVYTVTDGFEGDKLETGSFKGQRLVNGWKNSDLPWTYDLDFGKFY